MRICLIGNAAAVHLQRWARAYVEQGHDVHIVSIRTAEIPGTTMHVRRVGHERSSSTASTLLSYGVLMLSARRILRSIDPDVVHAHYVTTSGVIARASGARNIVLTAWGSDVLPSDKVRHNPIVRLMNRWALRGAKTITSASEYMRTDIMNRYGVDDITVVPFGVDTSEFSPRDEPNTGPIVVGLAKALNHKYGIEHAIAALAITRESQRDMTLTIAGDGPLRSDLETLAGALGVSEAVSFLGRVDHDEMPDVMRSFDILINPSVVPESFGVAILEAEACEIPVVATDVGGVHETCISDKSALLIEPANPQAIADALSRLEDPEVRHAFGTAGRRFVEDRFSWHQSVDTMLEILDLVARS